MADKRRMALYASSALICMQAGLLIPFLPLIAEDKHLSELKLGIIFSTQPLAGTLISPFVGAFLYKLGRQNSILIAFWLSSVAFFASGVSVYMQETVFFGVNIASRAVSGVSSVGLFTVGNVQAVIAILASDYPENMFEYVGVNESSAGLGIVLGPLAGATLYWAFGFAGTFFVSSVFFLFAGMAVYWIVGADRPYVFSSKDENILRLGLRPKIVIAMLPLVFSAAAVGAQNMFISTHLKHNGLSTSSIALAFAGIGVCYLTTCMVFAKTIKAWNKKAVTMFASALTVISMSLVGPWPLFLPETLPIILFGFAIMPIGLGLLLIEIMPTLLEVATEDLALENNDKLIDKLSGIAYTGIENGGASFGQFLGPLMQGGLIQWLGIRESCGCVAGVGLGALIIYVGASVTCPGRKLIKKELGDLIVTPCEE